MADREELARCCLEVEQAGGNVLTFLKECGSKNPSAHWCVIKKNLKDADPESWAKLEASAKKDSVQTEKPVTCCAPSTREGVEVPDEVPEEKVEIPAKEPMTTEEAFNSLADGLKKITKPMAYDGFNVMSLESRSTGFKYMSQHGVMVWTFPGMHEISMTADAWRALVDEIPRVLNIFGI